MITKPLSQAPADAQAAAKVTKDVILLLQGLELHDVGMVLANALLNVGLHSRNAGYPLDQIAMMDAYFDILLADGREGSMSAEEYTEYGLKKLEWRLQINSMITTDHYENESTVGENAPKKTGS